MKKAHTNPRAAVAVCGPAFIAAPAIAALQADESSGRWGASGRPDRLEEQGFDVSGIWSAIKAGDLKTAGTLIQQSPAKHTHQLPAVIGNTTEGKPGLRMTVQPGRLEEQGYDISAIRAAEEAGDQETVMTLMQQFMEEHKQELHAVPEGRPEGPCKRHSTNQETVETDHRLGIMKEVPGINPRLVIA